MFLTRNDKTFRLCHVDFFVEIAIEESGFDIHRMDFPILKSRDGKKEMKGFEAGNGREGFGIVNAMYLGEAFSNKVSTKATICFVFEDPFALNDFAVRGKVNEIPSAGRSHHVEFILTSSIPFIGIGGG